MTKDRVIQYCGNGAFAFHPVIRCEIELNPFRCVPVTASGRHPDAHVLHSNGMVTAGNGLRFDSWDEYRERIEGDNHA